MINVYKIKIGEKKYEIEVESVTKKEGSIETSSSKELKEEKKGMEILAPMQGNIVDIETSVGQKVSEGDTILILEAMKMENAITAPKDGIITDILVTKNQMVNSDTVLFTIA